VTAAVRRCAVTGASGYVGRRLVQALEAAGWTVVRLERRSSGTGPAVIGDIRDPDALARLVADTAAVVHLAAWVHRAVSTPADVAECRAVNVEGTARLLEAMAATGRRMHLVFMSSSAVYGSVFDMVDEHAICRPATAYGQSKLEAEANVLQATGPSLTTCVLRPTVIAGPGAPGNLSRLIALIRRGLCPLAGGGRNRKSIVHVDDVVAAVLACLASPERVAGRRLNVAAEPPLTTREMVAAIARGVGRRPFVLTFPPATGQGLLRLAAAVPGAVGRRLAALGRELDTFAATTSIDGSEARRCLSLTFRPAAASLTEMATAAVTAG
jgi:nucleoside-diphosphate-sugar epimerase